MMGRFFLAAIVVLVLGACASTNNMDEVKTYAVQAIDSRDYNYAKKMCDELYAACMKDTTKNRVQSLCDLSLLYMRIADSTEYDANIENAVKCYREAYLADSAMAATCYDSIAVDDMAHWALMSSIVNSESMPVDSVSLDDDEMMYVNESDSIIN